LVIAAFRVVYNLLLYVTGLAATTGPGLVGIIGAVVLLVIAIKRFRGLNNGYVTFGQAFGIGFLASVISTLIRSTVDAIYFASVGQEFLAAQLQQTVRQIASAGLDPQAREAMTRLFEALFTPGGVLISGICSGIIGWFIISLIVAATMKRPPPITE